MNRTEAFGLFAGMVSVAQKELVSFTKSQHLNVDRKADKTVVTACDVHIDNALSTLARSKGVVVVSEEGAKEQANVRSGTYVTIDPIDGSLGYVEYVNWALANGGMDKFLSTDLGPQSDFCLLLGYVENGVPQYACCYHYVTNETILLDGNDANACIVENAKRKRATPAALYVDPRPGEQIQASIAAQAGVQTIVQATLGLKSLYVLLNDHVDALTIHRVQAAGLWDILPTAVAARAFGGLLLDDNGEKVKFNEYVVLPGRGATCIKGKRFLNVQQTLKTTPNPLH